MAADNEITALRQEIERLSRELDQASSEKIQSAQYGLGLLEEKGQLQLKCEDLETLYENARHELDITQEVRLIPIVFRRHFFVFRLWQVCCAGSGTMRAKEAREKRLSSQQLIIVPI